MKTYGDLDLKKIREDNGLDFAHFTYLRGQCSCCHGPLDMPARYWHKSKKPIKIQHTTPEGLITCSYELGGEPFDRYRIKYILFKNAWNGRGTVTKKDVIRGQTCVSYSLDAPLVEKVCRDLASQLDEDYVVVVPEDSMTCIVIRERSTLDAEEKTKYDKARKEISASGAVVVWEPKTR